MRAPAGAPRALSRRRCGPSGLERTAPGSGWLEGARDVVYAGTVDGVAARVGAGHRVTTTVQPTIVSVLLRRRSAAARRLLRAHDRPRRHPRRAFGPGDRRFDRRCIVATADEAAASPHRPRPRRARRCGSCSAAAARAASSPGARSRRRIRRASQGAAPVIDAVRRVVRGSMVNCRSGQQRTEPGRRP